MHVHVDGSVIEAIGCDRAPVQAITTPDLATNLALVIVEGTANVEAWPLAPTVAF